VFVYDLVEKRSVYANQAASSGLGYPKEKLMSADEEFWRSILHPDGEDALARWLKQLEFANEGEILKRKVQMKTSEGKWRWFTKRAIVLARTSDRKPLKILEIMEDITGV
jgi:PAS domain S-box-containing protein